MTDPMTATTIRLVEPDDVSLLPIIEREAASRFHAVGLGEIAEGNVSDRAFIDAIRRFGLALCAEVDEMVVGFLLAGELDQALHVYELSVASTHGRQGIGSGMVEAAVRGAETRGLKSLTLSTFSEVPWNAPFYRRLGFEAVERDDWTPGFHLLHAAEALAGVPVEKRLFMRKEIG